MPASGGFGNGNALTGCFVFVLVALLICLGALVLHFV